MAIHISPSIRSCPRILNCACCADVCRYAIRCARLSLPFVAACQYALCASSEELREQVQLYLACLPPDVLATCAQAGSTSVEHVVTKVRRHASGIKAAVPPQARTIGPRSNQFSIISAQCSAILAKLGEATLVIADLCQRPQPVHNQAAWYVHAVSHTMAPSVVVCLLCTAQVQSVVVRWKGSTPLASQRTGGAGASSSNSSFISQESTPSQVRACVRACMSRHGEARAVLSASKLCAPGA